MLFALRDNDVHIWYTMCDNTRTPALRERCLSLLSPEEREQHDRFVFEKDRLQYRVAHALLRSILSRYLAVPPRELTFVRSYHGKPSLAHQANLPPVHFNLTTTERLVACAVTLHHPLGIDAESMDRPIDLAVADVCFSPAEIVDLAGVPESMKKSQFFQYWTLKEAYVKARGLGLAIPLTQFTFTMHDKSPPTISFAPECEDDPRNWQFHQLLIDTCHWLAVAVCRPTDQPSRFLLHEASNAVEPRVDDGPSASDIRKRMEKDE